jgi:hypothetical protein
MILIFVDLVRVGLIRSRICTSGYKTLPTIVFKILKRYKCIRGLEQMEKGHDEVQIGCPIQKSEKLNGHPVLHYHKSNLSCRLDRRSQKLFVWIYLG